MVLLAFSLQDQIDKYGTYVGIAAFFGLAVLTLLYFAQAREVKRLREWAGRAPERAAELEQAVAEHAEEVRRAPATPVPAPQPAPVPQVAQTVPATNGAVKLKPAEVAALAFARSAGVHQPHEPKAHPAPVAAAAVAAPPTETVAAPAVGNGEPPKALNGDGAVGGHGVKPATPAARRVEPPPPPPLPPRRVAAAAAAGRRTTSAPPPRESGSRAVILTAIIGVLVLAGAVYGILQLGGGGEDPAPKGNVVATPTPEDGGGDDPAATATAAPRVTKENANVGVLNATGAPNLAANNAQLLFTEGYAQDNVDTGNLDQRQTSVVLYARGARSAAADVADVLGISSVKQLADDPQVKARVDQSETKWDVVAVVGADKN
jgi:hypothetical protein